MNIVCVAFHTMLLYSANDKRFVCFAVAIGTPIMVTVEEEGDVAAFANFEAPAAAAAEAPPPAAAPPAKEETAAVAAAAAPEPVVAAAPPPTAAVAAPSPVTAAAAAAAATAPTAAAASFSTAWGLGVLDSSPLAQTLAKEQNAFLAKYGTTGQAPIL